MTKINIWTGSYSFDDLCARMDGKAAETLDFVQVHGDVDGFMEYMNRAFEEYNTLNDVRFFLETGRFKD